MYLKTHTSAVCGSVGNDCENGPFIRPPLWRRASKWRTRRASSAGRMTLAVSSCILALTKGAATPGR